MKIAIITGASSGMGREAARQLADRFSGLQEVWLIARRMDRMQELEFIINFCSETNNRKVLNSLRQLLKNQKAREEYLHGERHYNKRAARNDGVRVHPENGSAQQNATA